jgi:hypothetical protein
MSTLLKSNNPVSGLNTAVISPRPRYWTKKRVTGDNALIGAVARSPLIGGIEPSGLKI